MRQFWSQQEAAKLKEQRRQVGVSPLYEAAVRRKKELERQDNERGMMVKREMLKRTTGREIPLHAECHRKQEEVHSPHHQRIS